MKIINNSTSYSYHCYTSVPELPPQRQKGVHIWVNVIIWILKKKNPISSDNREKTQDLTIRAEDHQGRMTAILRCQDIKRKNSK
jgi:hypothetical protein